MWAGKAVKSALPLRTASLKMPPMLAKVCSAAVNGIEAYPFKVEVNSGWGEIVIVMMGSISPILCAKRLQAMCYSAKLI